LQLIASVAVDPFFFGGGFGLLTRRLPLIWAILLLLFDFFNNNRFVNIHLALSPIPFDFGNQQDQSADK
jgi:hypothetical protein